MSTGAITLKAAMNIQANNAIADATQFQKDLSAPDDISVIWPQPHDAKLELSIVIRDALGTLKGADGNPLTWIKVIEYGSFDLSLLRDTNGNQVPVIVLNRSSDTPLRRGLGEQMTVLPQGSPNLTDVNNIVPQGGSVDFRGQFSRVIIDVWIFDTVPDRCDQLYTIVKTILIALQKIMMDKLGYIEVTRVNGMDQQKIEFDQNGSVYVVYQRTLTYRIEHPDIIAGVQQVAHLIRQTQSLETPGGGATTASTSGSIP